MYPQDDLLDEDRLMLDRSPDEMGSHGNDMDELCASDSSMDDDDNEITHDGERTIYPWMKKIHVAGVGEYFPRPNPVLFNLEMPNDGHYYQSRCIKPIDLSNLLKLVSPWAPSMDHNVQKNIDF